MRRVASKFVLRLLSVDQKQQRLDFCLDLKENAANDPSFLSNVNTGDETWVYAYDPETKTQSSQWKSPGSPRPKRQGKWEATSSQCWFVSLIRRELFIKNLFLLVKQLMLHSTSKFWNVYGRRCKGSDLISGETTHDCSTMTMRQPMLPSWLERFWLITWLWCHILPTRPTLHPATFSYFQNWKWSLRGEDFRRWRKFKQSHRPSWTC